MNQYKLLESPRVEKLAALFLIAAAALVGLQAVGALKGLFEPRAAYGNVITVEGIGKVTAIPDIAQITFSVNEEADTAADAQNAAAEKINAALELLKNDLSIEDRDIKTTYYYVSPKYSYPRPCYSGFCPEIQYEQTIVGYTASQSIEVKIRDTAKVGEVLSVLGQAGIDNLSGPTFTIDDPEALKAAAREQAIEQARTKAKELAKDLNVRIVRVTGFWENSGGYYPYYEKGFGGADVAQSAVVPELPVGESEVQVMVSVSYEIR